MLTPRQTAGRAGQDRCRRGGGIVVQTVFIRRGGKVEVAPLNNSHSLGFPPPAVVKTPCVGAVTASCLSGARDGVEQWWRR